MSSLNLLFILFAFLFQVVLASVFGFYLPVRRGGTFWAKIFSSRLLGMATWTQSLYWSFFSNSNTRGAWPLGTRSGTRMRKCSGWARLSSNPSRTNSIRVDGFILRGCGRSQKQDRKKNRE